VRHTTNKFSRDRFEVYTAVTMKSGIFWDIKPCGSSQLASVASYS
jgi:hypothetical protein